jgi:HAD superfamily hydrolase (TIGR01509 family)
MLDELRDAGLAIGVVTSKARERFADDARRIGLDALVDVSVCVEDTDRHKPDPAPVLLALDQLGVRAERAVMVGDTPVDVAAGAAAGTGVYGVAWGMSDRQPLLDAGASAVAPDTGDLIRLVLDHEGERGIG